MCISLQNEHLSKDSHQRPKLNLCLPGGGGHHSWVLIGLKWRVLCLSKMHIHMQKNRLCFCFVGSFLQSTDVAVRDSLWSTLRSSRPTDATLAIRSPPTHLVVLIHGLQGSSADLDFLRRELMMQLLMVVCSRLSDGRFKLRPTQHAKKIEGFSRARG